MWSMENVANFDELSAWMKRGAKAGLKPTVSRNLTEVVANFTL